MQIELIATASEDSAYLPRLGLGTLAALTPASDDETRREAYYRYLRRDGASDDEIADWLDAEAELRARGRESLPDPPAEARP